MRHTTEGASKCRRKRQMNLHRSLQSRLRRLTLNLRGQVLQVLLRLSRSIPVRGPVARREIFYIFCLHPAMEGVIAYCVRE